MQTNLFRCEFCGQKGGRGKWIEVGWVCDSCYRKGDKLVFLRTNLFKCERCGGVFEATNTEEECDEIFKQDFGDLEQGTTVCERCYDMIMKESAHERN